MFRYRTQFQLIIVASLVLLVSGCTTVIRSVTSDMAENLSQAILNQDDPGIVRDGAPAFLLMLDSFVAGSPDDVSLLLSGSKLYGAYATAFVEDEQRRLRLTDKAYSMATHAFCVKRSDLCPLLNKPADEFSVVPAELKAGDVAETHQLAVAWAGWIQARSKDWNAIADIPKIKVLMARVLELQESYDDGSAHIYLGVLNTLLPPALGGKPDIARVHFERAMALSAGKNFMAKVLFAKHYARLIFNRELHDKLLGEVVSANPVIAGYTLTNTLAQQQARELLESSEVYF